MRINKYISQAGVASRRKSDELVLNGAVRVNGKVMRTVGYEVLEDDVVEVGGVELSSKNKKVYYVINKPVGYITSSKDERDRPTVMELVKDIDARLFPVGRLDYNTSGLLIMTNDGDLSFHISHPKHHVFKTYRALVSGVVSNEKIAKLRKGVDIGGFITAPARVSVIKGTSSSSLVEISIREGKNRQVRKMFKSVGNPVQALERVSIGELKIGHLKEGHYRKLTKEEVEYLKNC